MADMEDVHRVLLDGEQDSVDVRPAAVKKLSDLERKPIVFRSQATSLRKTLERLYGLLQSEEPAESRFPGLLAEQPFQNRLCFAFAPGVVSTRKIMLRSEFVQELLGWTMTSRAHIFVSALDARDGFFKVPQFTVEKGG